MARSETLSAAEAAARLGVARASLYAYVSRGLIRSEGERTGSRARRYRREDVDALLQRREGRRDPSVVSRAALHFGAPVLESALGRIDAGRLFYRRFDAIELSRRASLESVAMLLWSGSLDAPFPDAAPASVACRATARAADARAGAALRLARDLPALEAAQLVLSHFGAHDPAAWDLSPEGVRRTGARIVRTLAGVAVGAPPSPVPVADVLARGLGVRGREGRAALQAALVLWADHELNVSTFTARCVASARATPWHAVIAALSALRGARHGGATEQAAALLDEIGEPRRAASVLEARLRRGELLPGFGHPLYPEGDPRAAELLDRVARLRPAPRAAALAATTIEHAHALCGQRPNVDFALAALCRALALPPRAMLSLVAVARSVGWISHVIEQLGDERLIRPRARFVGEMEIAEPQETHAPQRRRATQAVSASRGRSAPR